MIAYYLLNKINLIFNKRIVVYEYLDLTWLHEYVIEKKKLFYVFTTLKGYFLKKMFLNLCVDVEKQPINCYKTHIFIIKNMYAVYVISTTLFIFKLTTVMYFNFWKNLLINTMLVFFIYFFITTFYHFSKTYNTNKYTSQTQRFWKRTFGAFWSLEFFLFAIYMFLTLISPAELPMYAINYKEIITGINIVKYSTYHIHYLTVLFAINIMFAISIFLKKKNNYILIACCFIVINLSYCYVIYFEFFKIYYVAGWGNHSYFISNKSSFVNNEYNSIFNTANNNIKNEVLYFKVPASINNTWNETYNEKQWLRTFRHFLYILIILKFWHVFFIFFYLNLSIFKFIEIKYVSYDVLSSNYQNAIYVTWFYFVSYLLILKKKFYFMLIMMYSITYTHINFTQITQNVLNEMYIFYFV